MYGTLRPGLGNYKGLLAGRTVSEETVTVPGYEMWGATFCPFIIETGNPEDIITGTLIYVDEGRYSKIQRSLDSLEGYRGPGLDNWYERKLINVTANGTVVKAWTYVVEDGTAEAVKARHRRVPGGDWLAQESVISSTSTPR